MKVAILWQYLFHYRIPFYRQLGQIPGVDLTILHGGVMGPAAEGIESRCGRESFRTIKIKTTIKPLLGAVLYFQTGIWRHLIRERYDLIVCEGNFGMITNLPVLLYGKLSGKPVLFWTAGWERGRVKGLTALVRRFFIRISARLPDGYLCYGINSRDFLLKFGVDASRCAIVQNTIDIEEIAQHYEECLKAGQQEKERLGLTEKTIILTVGELRPSKRVDVLLEAFREIRSKRDNVSLLLIGDGPEKHGLIRTTVDKGIPDVIFLGSVFTGIGRYFAMSDLFILPGEGGLAINEAMAYGLPVICSSADGTEKDLVIEGLTGSFFKSGSADALACCIEKLLSSPEALRTMGIAARNHVYDIASLQKSVQQFAHVLEQHGNSGIAPSGHFQSTL